MASALLAWLRLPIDICIHTHAQFHYIEINYVHAYKLHSIYINLRKLYVLSLKYSPISQLHLMHESPDFLISILLTLQAILGLLRSILIFI